MSKFTENVDELDIFSGPALQAAVTGEDEVEYYPINSITTGQPIQFDIPETYTQMTDPSFLLKIRVKITEKDGTVLKDNARVGPVNLLLHSLFKDVVLKANGVIISQATGLYPYRAYIETNYTYSAAAKNGAVGIPQLYYKDKRGAFNGVIASINPAFDSRMSRFEKSKEVEMVGRLHCDLLMQNKFIVPGVRFSISLFPSSTAFHLMSGTDVPGEKLEIVKLTLKVRRVNLTNNAILSIERSLQKTPAQYSINRAVVRTTQLSIGQTFLSNFILSSGQIPRLIIVTTMSTDALTGLYIRSPFNFETNECISAQLSVNGRHYPPIAYTPSTSMIEPYLNSLRMVRKLYSDSDTGITLDDFMQNGHPILPFDLNPDEQGVPPRSNGVVSFSAQWTAAAFADSGTLIFYLLWDNIISIDGRKNIIMDYVP